MLPRLLLLLLIILPLGSCSVYVPMQGAAPDITGRGQLEVTGSYSLTNRLDASVAYSPLPHVLGRVALSNKGRHPTAPDTSAYARVGQYELALGTYWPLGERGLVGALAGYGALHVDARYQGDGVSLNLSTMRQVPFVFAGSYRKLLGEAYASYRLTPTLSLGASYRLARLHLTDVTNNGQPVQAAPFTRSELMFFARLRPRTVPAGLVQVQVALGSSRTLGYDAFYASPAVYASPARQFQQGEAYLMVGLYFYPGSLWQQKQP